MKAKKRIATLAMACIVASGAALIPQGVTAKADETPTYEKLYYFSDYAGSASYRNGGILRA